MSERQPMTADYLYWEYFKLQCKLDQRCKDMEKRLAQILREYFLEPKKPEPPLLLTYDKSK